MHIRVSWYVEHHLPNKEELLVYLSYCLKVVLQHDAVVMIGSYNWLVQQGCTNEFSMRWCLCIYKGGAILETMMMVVSSVKVSAVARPILSKDGTLVS